MEIIEISIIDTHLEKMEIPQEDEWVDFHFHPSKLTGYWISNDDDGNPMETMVYIGGHKFITRYDELTINKLNRILNEKG